MFSIHVDYPSLDEEVQVVASTTCATDEAIKPVITREQLLEMQKLVREVPASEPVVRYAVELVRATRPGDPSASEEVKNWVAWGAGPRASQYLILGGKARAITQGRTAVTVADVRALAGPVLRHRIVVNFQAEAEGVTSDAIIAKLLAQIPGV
jgi:MoxR-like ATPase